MKKTLYTLAALLVFNLVFIYTNPNPPYGNKKPLVKKEETSIGTKDNPNARRDYEFMMLRDPVTNKIPANIYNLEQAFADKLPKVTDLDNANSLVWAERGPNNVGGRTRALAPDVTNADVILAGGVSGGMWRSVNFGTSWTKTTTSAQLHSTTCIAQDIRTGKTNIWYVGTGERLGNSANAPGGEFHGNGIFKSVNGGLNWSLLPSTSGNPAGGGFSSGWQYVWNVVTDPSNASQDIVYAATYGAIYRSSNAGNNWDQVLGDTSSTNEFTDITITQAGVLYASGSFAAGSSMNGIRRSTNGTSWDNITPAAFPPTYGRIVLTTAPSNPNVLYAVVQGTPDGVSVNKHQFWKYTYNGTSGTWVNRTANLPQSGQGNFGIGNEPFDSQDGYDLFIKVKPDNENFVMLSTTNIYRSTDGFATTANTRRIGGYLPVHSDYDSVNYMYPNHHADVHSGFFKNGSNIQFVSGHDGGISVTTDITANVSFYKPVTWTSLNNGYNVTQFYGVALAPENGSQKLIGGFQDNGTYMTNSSALSVPWTDVGSGDGCYCECPPAGDLRIYTSSQNGSVTRINFTPNPDSTISINPYLAKRQLFVNPFALDPVNSSIMFYAGGYDTATQKTGIWRNLGIKLADTLRGWSYLSGSGFGNTLAQVSAIGISKANSPNVVYYGTTYGDIKRITNSNLATPTISPNLRVTGMPAANISCLAVDPTNSAKVMAIFSNYNVASVWYSTNSGANWTSHEGNLTGTAAPSIRWAEIFYVQTVMHIVLSTSTGIYYTTALNGSNTVWTQEAVSAIGNVVCVMTKFRDSDKTLVVATHGRGAFQSQVTVPISVGQISSEIPAAYSLSQNYPNPFNPTTVIRFGIPSLEGYAQRGVGIITLKIFDITGREISTLINEKLAPGTYSVPFNAAMLPSGVYFYKLTASAYTSTKKMLLIK